ncbi:transposase [Bradyrhizobium sp. 190]|uniref:transposase n=1 Tax=Bradyrhizobium sp. 190 TaxID=2782658 RepID=UPI001FF773FA|nr:transposase [Bradyrhizobium sp. 190]
MRSLESECWIDRESSGCEFRDARLGDRFRKLLTQIGSPMGQSIPLVCYERIPRQPTASSLMTGSAKRTFWPAISLIVPPPLKVSFLCGTIQPSSAINAKSQKRSTSPRA